jgi:hypothetical protein
MNKKNDLFIWSKISGRCQNYSSTNLPINAEEYGLVEKVKLENRPYLALFGKNIVYFNKNTKEWVNKTFSEKETSLGLPWMGAEISLIKNENKLIPFNFPVEVLPIQKRGQLIKGEIKAVQIEIYGKDYWVTNFSPLALKINNEEVYLNLEKEKVVLPFEVSLTEFKMERDPGTNNPASYESFVKIFKDGYMSNAHIFMNNPMKLDGFTFYQASYSDNNDGTYNSTLTVNVDQGRSFKYLGSLMLVLGSIWHFKLNKYKNKEAA